MVEYASWQSKDGNAVETRKKKHRSWQNRATIADDFGSGSADSAESMEPVEVIQSIRTTFDYDRFIVDEDIPSPDDVKLNPNVA